jgi:signal transduction histidine kinase
VTGDRDRLAQLLDNLISNAVKFTPEQGRVALGLTAQNGHLALDVMNTGSHIPESERNLLFDRFFRSQTASEQAVPGVGLGLTISKAIVDAHGGAIGVDSDAEVGTTFHIELPVNGASRDYHVAQKRKETA